MPNVFPTLYPVFDTLLPFSSENKDKVFNPRILASKEEKSPHLLSHRGFKVFQLINDSESPMMIYGEDIPILDVLFLHFYLDQLKYGGSSQAQDSVNKNKRFDCPDYEASRARGFVLRSLELQSFAYFYMGIQYPKSYRLTSSMGESIDLIVPAVVVFTYRIFAKGQKRSQSRQNRAREWKEHEESKPKTCAS
ncbi:hypothetical protein Tco_0947844 [Tanacetum coccineum]